MVLNSQNYYFLIWNKIPVGIHGKKSCLLVFWNFLYFFKVFFWKSDFRFGISIKFWEILNGSDPILVIELHTSSKSNFSVFLIFKVFGYFWLQKISWLIRWCWFRNFTNQSVIEIFDPSYDDWIIKKKLTHKIKHQKLIFIIIRCAL